ncbi:thioredoxin family protein [Azospirillum halopraeferens]|uniref:thioredoxin family protein n=1 Tax=Azospirillum halopraeferens TaxID=34010 RepID=UPI0003FDBE0D|nr:thioredoxin family protein [Azospirillum halopraeferens]
MITRRGFALGGLALAAVAAPARGETVMTPDGLHSQSWFLDGSLDLNRDLAAATAAGKRFVIVWEQRGCSYCRDLHRVTLADPVIASYVRDHFAVLGLNMHGTRTLTDFDGERLAERRLVRKHGIAFTPSFQFFPEDPAAMAGKPVADAEVHRTVGLLNPQDFLATFRYVHERAYERQSFDTYLVWPETDEG